MKNQTLFFLGVVFALACQNSKKVNPQQINSNNNKQQTSIEETDSLNQIKFRQEYNEAVKYIQKKVNSKIKSKKEIVPENSHLIPATASLTIDELNQLTSMQKIAYFTNYRDLYCQNCMIAIYPTWESARQHIYLRVPEPELLNQNEETQLFSETSRYYIGTQIKNYDSLLLLGLSTFRNEKTVLNFISLCNNAFTKKNLTWYCICLKKYANAIFASAALAAWSIQSQEYFYKNVYPVLFKKYLGPDSHIEDFTKLKIENTQENRLLIWKKLKAWLNET